MSESNIGVKAMHEIMRKAKKYDELLVFPSIENELQCDFCGKFQSELNKMIAARRVVICNECVEVCNQVLEEDNS
ncbi:hypothetical protein PC41400_14710 [Paenibacillus chitinolyticus]|uniref:ClpX-type ZB domain-containing protein n=1 Tax=Paenibacillus chitinolyticus TaxID=79263 RepID=A0A410WXA1_9BACL|nr:ClpX C4-type zinc finger protein [Paenibacillus chitinolyticus]MCY9593976.1 hypothetical protein [Paenibacillus chitinolyticus]MCY9599631.1 hypothetical protein [Paenibacillus chitinolyticus]QAV18861.1 hypothetical protein PC41400_14710 [Paenibacillus chitinolyticus]